MDKLRVISVENASWPDDEGRLSPVISCVYKDNLIYIYDRDCELYRGEKFIGEFDVLEYLIKKKDYVWTDFYIEKGQQIQINSDGEIFVDGNPTEGIRRLPESKNKISRILTKLFYECLKKLYSENEKLIQELQKDFQAGTFDQRIMEILEMNVQATIEEGDLSIIMRSRLEGYFYVIDTIKKIFYGCDCLEKKNADVVYFFTRLFKLEKMNFIDFSIKDI